MLRNRVVYHLLFGILGAGVGIVASCQNEDTTSSCYPLSIWVDYGPSQASLRGFCRWGGDSGQDFPERDYGEGVYRRTVVRAVELDEGQLCDGCNAEQIDSLLRQEIENECDAPVLEFTRGCHEPHPRLAGWCFYTALYWAACEPSYDGDVE